MNTESLQFKIFTVISCNYNIECIDVWGKKRKLSTLNLTLINDLCYCISGTHATALKLNAEHIHRSHQLGTYFCQTLVFKWYFNRKPSFTSAKILSKTKNISLNTRLFKLYASLRSVPFFSKREMRSDDHIIQCLILGGYGIFNETYPAPNSMLKFSL